MAHEINFRVWDKDNKEMIYQGSNTTYNNSVMECQVSFDDMGCCVFVRHYGENGCSERKNTKLMQYTGLKDKNGKEIYESDLFRDEFRTYIVFWDSEDARWKLKSDCGKNRVYYMKLDDHSCLYGEVIGNEFQCDTKI